MQTVDSSIQWVGESARCFQGRADARYGVLRLPDGEDAFIKRLPSNANPLAEELIAQERAVLSELSALNIAAPKLLASAANDATTLVSEYAGVSLGNLVRQERLDAAELVTALESVFRVAEQYAKCGVLPMDISAANVVLPLERGLDGGRVKLRTPIFVDHAMTLVPGMLRRRPLWMHPHMMRIAPELRAALQADHDEMLAAFAEQGCRPKPLEAMTVTDFDAVRRCYGSFRLRQLLQSAIDTRLTNVDAALQYSIGRLIETTLGVLSAPTCERFSRVIDRLRRDRWQDRFSSLDEACGEWSSARSASGFVSVSVSSQALPPVWTDSPAATGQGTTPTGDETDGTFLPSEATPNNGALQDVSAGVASRQFSRRRTGTGSNWPVLAHSAARLFGYIVAATAVAVVLVQSGAWYGVLAPVIYRGVSNLIAR